MSVNIGVLGQVLFSPMKAFESIRDKTTMADGIIMAVILSLIAGIISMVVVSSLVGITVTGLIIGVVMAVVVVLAVGWLSSVLAKAIFKGSGDMNVTVGLLGYAGVVNLVMQVLRTLLAVAGVSLIAVSVTPYGGVAAGMTAIGWVIALVAFIWTLYVSGSAVAVANKINLVGGAVSYFIAALIIGLILGVILAAILLSAGGMAGLGLMGGLM